MEELQHRAPGNRLPGRLSEPLRVSHELRLVVSENRVDQERFGFQEVEPFALQAPEFAVGLERDVFVAIVREIGAFRKRVGQELCRSKTLYFLRFSVHFLKKIKIYILKIIRINQD